MDDFVEKFQDSGGREKGHQWIVGCKYVESTKLLAARLRKVGAKVAVYHGGVDPADRTKIEDEFQTGVLDAVIGTTQSMKEGITLTRGHLMYALTAEWVPADNEQWESRAANRTGQQHFTVIYRPQTPNTVATDNVRVTNQRKERIVRSVVASDTIEEVTHT
jgi:superfamily II helicase